MALILTITTSCLCRDGQVALDVTLTTAADGITTVSGCNSETAFFVEVDAAVVVADGSVATAIKGYIHVIDQVLVPRETRAATLAGTAAVPPFLDWLLKSLDPPCNFT